MLHSHNLQKHFASSLYPICAEHVHGTHELNASSLDCPLTWVQPIFGDVPLCYLHIRSLPVSNSSWCSSHPRSTLIYYRRFQNMFYLLVVQHSSDKNPVMTPISSLGPTHSNSRNLSCTSCLEGELDVKNKQTFPHLLKSAASSL